MITENTMRNIDSLIRLGGRWMPFWGWHDNHRPVDGTEDYRPALQQVRSEFVDMANVIADQGLIGSRALQLGSGMCDASHHVWNVLFGDVATIDWRNCLYDETVYPGADTHSHNARDFAKTWGPYDFIFVDAGHKFEDLTQDYADYYGMLREGGIIAFHDALPREGHDVDVHEFLRRLGAPFQMIGGEVGTAWMIK